MKKIYDAVVCGGGIIGLATARNLAVTHGLKVCIVDPNPLVSMTSAVSTECYRDVWIDESMRSLIGRSIHLIETRAQKSGNAFSLNRNGYLFVSTSDDRFCKPSSFPPDWPVRTPGSMYVPNQYLGRKPDLANTPDGMDLLTAAEAKNNFKFLAEARDVEGGGGIVAALHARRCGWMDAQQLAMSILDDAKLHGTQVYSGWSLGDIRVKSNRVEGVTMFKGEQRVDIESPTLINAAGPFAQKVHSLLGRERPNPFELLEVTNTLHAKAIIKDTLKVIPYTSPMIITVDPIMLDWSGEEKEALSQASSEELNYLFGPAWSKAHLEALPPGAHVRPTTSGHLIFVWEHGHSHKRAVSSLGSKGLDSGIIGSELGSDCLGSGIVGSEVMELGQPSIGPFYQRMVEDRLDPLYPQMVIKAMSSIIPELKQYIDSPPFIDHTSDGRSIIGGLSGLEGYLLNTAFAGYGIMAAEGAGELCALQATGSSSISLPSYAADFDPLRNGKQPQDVQNIYTCNIGGTL
ncbi:hypothetical protein AAMO2058_001145600 [Amorphochlora amoebiformis]